MNKLPKSRDLEIVTHETDGETLVYDLASHKVHCLNQTSASVWQNCDGNSSVSEIAQRQKLPEEFVLVAIDKLQKANLLAENLDLNIAKDRLSRRKLLFKAAATTAAALPLITTLAAPTAIQAQSGACLEVCGSFRLSPDPFFADTQACVDALLAAAVTRCCSGTLNPSSAFNFGSDPQLCQGFCGTSNSSCITDV